MTQNQGIALWCNQQGIILDIIRDNLGITTPDTLGTSFIRLVDTASVPKTLNFLSDLQQKSASFDWELNIPYNNSVITLHFTGMLQKDGLLIVGAYSNAQALVLYEELAKINNQHVNTIRMAIKQQSDAKRQTSDYNRMSQLNNDLVNLQRELAKKNVELEMLNQQKNHFLGMAAHDLRSPLSHIMGFSQLLRDETAHLLNDTQLEFLDIIHDSSHYMRAMINDLLDLTTIEAGLLQLNLQPIDLMALVKKQVDLNQRLASGKQIQLHLTQVDTIPVIQVDEAKIKQVLDNLISNAVKYSYPQTAVTIHLQKQADTIILSVADEGQGIPDDQLDRLFKPFSRTDVQSTGGEKSTGLGLAIVRRIVEGHQGRIWVESKVGQGSTFYVSLPM